MDDRGRLAQPLNWNVSRLCADGAVAPAALSPQAQLPGQRFRLMQLLNRRLWLLASRLPRGAGIIATASFMLASLAYGTIRGDHVGSVIVAFEDARDRLGNLAGFRITSIALTGNHHVSRE